MLDVHPPHHPTNTWRDFFIHVATICVGLLIAVGLEQIVERVHEHYQLVETRHALEDELELNRQAMHTNVINWRWEMAGIENNLLVLKTIQAHPDIKDADLPGTMVGVKSPFTIHTAVWDAAQKSGITRLMPLDEANHYDERYKVLEEAGKQDLDCWNTLNLALRFRSVDGTPSHLKPTEVDDALHLMETAWEQQILVGDSLGLTHARFPELQIDFTWDEVAQHIHLADKNSPELNVAQDKTQTRLTAAGHPKSLTLQ